MHAPRIVPLTADHLPAARTVIDAVGLFPSALLDGMAAPFLDATAPEEIWCVATLGGTVAALAYGAPERMTKGTWNLLLIAVDPARQGQGLAGRLTRHVEAEARRRGGRIMLVETSALPGFGRTRAVYSHLGYVEEGRIRGFYAAGEDKVIFWKALGEAAAGPAGVGLR